MLHKDSEQKKDRQADIANTIYAEDCTPIVFHYFTGGKTLLTSFGHVALQFGRYYLSHGQGEASSHAAPKSLLLFTSDQIKEDHEKYGGAHIRFELRPPKNVDLVALIKKWFATFNPQNYSLTSCNCCHAIAWLLIHLGYIDKMISAQLGILRPADVGKALFSSAHKELSAREKSIKDAKACDTTEALIKRLQYDIDVMTLDIEEKRMNSTPVAKLAPFLTAMQLERTLCFGVGTEHYSHPKEYKIVQAQKKPLPEDKAVAELRQRNFFLAQCIAHHQEISIYNALLHLHRAAPYYNLLKILIEQIHHNVITAKNIAALMEKYQALLLLFKNLEKLYSIETSMIQYQQLAQDMRNLFNPGKKSHLDYDKQEKVANIESITAILQAVVIDLDIDAATKATQALIARYDLKMRDLKAATAVDQKAEIQLQIYPRINIIHNHAIMDLLRFLIDDFYFWESNAINSEFFIAYYQREKMFFQGLTSAHEVITETLATISQLVTMQPDTVAKKLRCVELFVNHAIKYGDTKVEDVKKIAASDEELNTIFSDIHSLPSNFFSNYLKSATTQLMKFASEKLITPQHAILKLKAIATETAKTLYKELSPIATNVEKIVARLGRVNQPSKKPVGSVLFIKAPIAAAATEKIDDGQDEKALAFEM